MYSIKLLVAFEWTAVVTASSFLSQNIKSLSLFFNSMVIDAPEEGKVFKLSTACQKNKVKDNPFLATKQFFAAYPVMRE